MSICTASLERVCDCGCAVIRLHESPHKAYGDAFFWSAFLVQAAAGSTIKGATATPMQAGANAIALALDTNGIEEAVWEKYRNGKPRLVRVKTRRPNKGEMR